MLLMRPVRAELGDQPVQLHDLLGLELEVRELSLHFLLDLFLSDPLRGAAARMAAVIDVAFLDLADQPMIALPAGEHATEQEGVALGPRVGFPPQDRLNLLKKGHAHERFVHAGKRLAGFRDSNDARVERVIEENRKHI